MKDYSQFAKINAWSVIVNKGTYVFKELINQTYSFTIFNVLPRNFWERSLKITATNEEDLNKKLKELGEALIDMSERSVHLTKEDFNYENEGEQ